MGPLPWVILYKLKTWKVSSAFMLLLYVMKVLNLERLSNFLSTSQVVVRIWILAWGFPNYGGPPGSSALSQESRGIFKKWEQQREKKGKGSEHIFFKKQPLLYEGQRKAYNYQYTVLGLNVYLCTKRIRYAIHISQHCTLWNFITKHNNMAS